MRQVLAFAFILSMVCMALPEVCRGARGGSHWHRPTKPIIVYPPPQPPSPPKTPQTPPQPDPTQVRCEQMISQAGEYVRAKKWAQANAELKKASAIAGDETLQDRISDLRSQVDAEGQRQLKECDAAFAQKRYPEAIAGYRKIAASFDGLPSAEAARKALKAAEADPEVQRAQRELDAQNLEATAARIIDPAGAPAAETRPAQGPTPNAVEPPKTDTAVGPAKADAGPGPSRVEKIKPLPVEKQDAVMDVLEQLARRFPQTEPGKRAAADLKVLEGDETLMIAVRTFQANRRARGLFSSADAYLRAGMKTEALQQYKKLLKDFPNSDLTEDARKKIKELEQ